MMDIALSPSFPDTPQVTQGQRVLCTAVRRRSGGHAGAGSNQGPREGRLEGGTVTGALQNLIFVYR